MNLNRVGSWMMRGALIIVLIVIVAMVVGPFIDIGLSAYLIWHRGYGLACDGRILSEALSPAKQWFARVRLVSCGGVPGGQSTEVVLVPNVTIPLAVRYKLVFLRDTGSERRDPSDHLIVRWLDDHSLELQGIPCVPCQSRDYHLPCDSWCGLLYDVSGVTVSLKPIQK
jgi:hypothetical protein